MISASDLLFDCLCCILLHEYDILPSISSHDK